MWCNYKKKLKEKDAQILRISELYINFLNEILSLTRNKNNVVLEWDDVFKGTLKVVKKTE
tara:strand:+ start:1047 stop:1226 length:180 start_codon:yes stop_codon:yes gene_type:complete